MHSKLKARLARLGPIRDADQSPSGSPVKVVLRPLHDRRGLNKPVTAIQVLAAAGLSMLRSKRAYEAMIEQGETVIVLPAVSDLTATVKALSRAGVTLSTFANEIVDVKALRTQLGLSQEQFALRYNLALATVQNWEQGRVPDAAANNYLRVIAADPVLAAKAQEAAGA